MASEADDDWQPPTETEMKVIQARRERSDKISKMMGDYLLKGYKMLGSSCAECGTILLRDRQDKDYCVACSELESDTVKDNPALSTTAALVQARESLYHRITPNSVRSESPDEMLVDNLGTAGMSNGQPNSDGGSRLVNAVVSHQEMSLSADAKNTVKALEDKMTWATNELKSNVSVEYSIQICHLIKACSDALISIRKLSCKPNSTSHVPP